ncbi:MAG TPA: hypothetical protein VGJ45_31840 [Pseudonocardiaceae bacterium]|jgi:hypothetical protein
MTIRDHAIASTRTLRPSPTPDPFSPSTTERAERRAFNDSVLRPDLPLHHLARGFAAIVRTEAATLLGTVGYAEFGWPEFSEVWWSAARRITLGESAREDHDVTGLRGPNQDAIARYLLIAEPRSLAAEVARAPVTSGVDPIGELRHWLFGFGAAGIVTFRALALLAAHPEQAGTARAELAATDFTELAALPYLRACVLESIRRWPPAQGSDTFAPDRWLDAGRHQPVLPFGTRTAVCPGRNIVLGSAATMLGALLARREFTLAGQPALDHTELRFLSRRCRRR